MHAPGDQSPQSWYSDFPSLRNFPAYFAVSPSPNVLSRHHLPALCHHKLVCFVQFYTNRITQYVPLCAWHFSFKLMFLRYIHVLCIRSLIIFMNEYSIAWMLHILFTQSSVDGNLGCFQFGALINKATMNICIKILTWIYIFISLGQIPRAGIAGSYVKWMFNFIRNCQTVLQNDYAIFHSLQEVVSNPCYHLISPVFSHFSHFMSVSWYFIVDLICISLMTNNFENFSCA